MGGAAGLMTTYRPATAEPAGLLRVNSLGAQDWDNRTLMTRRTDQIEQCEREAARLRIVLARTTTRAVKARLLERIEEYERTARGEEAPRWSTPRSRSLSPRATVCLLKRANGKGHARQPDASSGGTASRVDDRRCDRRIATLARSVRDCVPRSFEITRAGGCVVVRVEFADDAMAEAFEREFAR